MRTIIAIFAIACMFLSVSCKKELESPKRVQDIRIEAGSGGDKSSPGKSQYKNEGFYHWLHQLE